MKRIFFIVAFAAAACTAAAQNYMVVNSEKVYKSIDAYNKAIAELDKLAETYQTQVDAKFTEVEALYNNYMNQRNSLSAVTREAREKAILEREQEANDYQQSIFRPEGTLMKKRVEMIQPIQKKVFDAIARYASENGFDLVLDATNNPTLLYNAPALDRTEALIQYLK